MLSFIGYIIMCVVSVIISIVSLATNGAVIQDIKYFESLVFTNKNDIPWDTIEDMVKIGSGALSFAIITGLIIILNIITLGLDYSMVKNSGDLILLTVITFIALVASLIISSLGYVANNKFVDKLNDNLKVEIPK